MRPKSCKIKELDEDFKFKLGTLSDISQMEGGKSVVIQRADFLPVPRPEDILVSNDILEIMASLLGQSLRTNISIRDTIGNVVEDFNGWASVQNKGMHILRGDHGEDLVNKIWYGVEKLLDSVFVHLPYYTLSQIHFSAMTNEVVFVGDYASANTRHVQIFDHTCPLQPESIVNKVIEQTKMNW